MNKSTEDVNFTSADPGGGVPYGIETGPIEAWEEGLDQTVGPHGAQAQNIDHIGAKPTDSKTFNMRYKVLKKIKMKFNPSDERKISFTFKPNRILDQAYVDKNKKYRGLNLLWMHTHHGVSADGANAISAANITTTPAKFVGIFDYEYTFRAINVFPRMQVTYNNIDGFGESIGTGAPAYTLADASGTLVDSNVSTNHA